MVVVVVVVFRLVMDKAHSVTMTVSQLQQQVFVIRDMPPIGRNGVIPCLHFINRIFPDTTRNGEKLSSPLFGVGIMPFESRQVLHLDAKVANVSWQSHHAVKGKKFIFRQVRILLPERLQYSAKDYTGTHQHTPCLTVELGGGKLQEVQDVAH